MKDPHTQTPESWLQSLPECCIYGDKRLTTPPLEEFACPWSLPTYLHLPITADHHHSLKHIALGWLSSWSFSLVTLPICMCVSSHHLGVSRKQGLWLYIYIHTYITVIFWVSCSKDSLSLSQTNWISYFNYYYYNFSVCRNARSSYNHEENPAVWFF